MNQYKSNQFPQQHKPKVEVWQLFDIKAKCRVTFGTYALCVAERKKKSIPKNYKIIPNA